MGGGHFSAGFRGSVFNAPGMKFDPENGNRPGAAQVTTLIHFFKKRTQFQRLEPRFELVADPDLCLRGRGELVIYAPKGGDVIVDLAGETGDFTVTWLNPVSGENREAAPVQGGQKV